MKLASLAVCLLALAGPANAGDWSHWRGPFQNGVSLGDDLPEKFAVDKAGADNLIWSAPYGCRSTPLVLNGRVFFNGSVGRDQKAQERVVCLDATSGKLLWEHRFNVFHTDIVMARVGWTNLAADTETGNVYCHGTGGTMLCFNKDGKVLWERSLTEEFGRVSGYGGRLSSPTVDGELVIVGMACAAWGEYGRGGCRFVAFDKKTGKVVWFASTMLRVLDTFQSSPIVANIKDQRLLICGGADGSVHAFKVRTGEKVWSLPIASGAVNVTPVIDGTRVYIAHGDINPDASEQGRVICIDAAEVKDGKPKIVWKIEGPKIKFSAPILHDGRLYMIDDGGLLSCFDAGDGTEIWRLKYGKGSNVRCSPVLSNGKLYVGDASSSFYVLKPGKESCKKVLKLFLRSQTPGVDAELDGAAAVSDGRLYFATNETMFCVGKKDPAPIEGTSNSKRTAVEPGKPAYLQVVPGDVTLGAGESETFKARLFDDKGNFLRETKAEWSLAPMLPVEATPGLPPPPKINPPALKGELTEDGKLTVDGKLQGQFGNVVAKAEGLRGHARVRQVPKLPYKQDFEKLPVGASPAGWVNTQVKFQVRKEGDGNVLVKTATNPSPLAAIATAYIGLPSLSNYTIESDVLAKKVNGELPDMGVVACRYTFEMSGKTQQLRLISWDALPRIDNSIGFRWKEDVWYRLKLSVQIDGDKGTIRAKVWERAKTEPEKWTLEVDDANANKEGAPGLFANVPPASIKPMKIGSEVFFDNVSIVPNKDANKRGQAPAKAPEKQAPVAAPPIVVEAIPCETPSARPRLLRRFRW